MVDHWILLVVKVRERKIFMVDPDGTASAQGLVQSLVEFLRNEVFFDRLAHIQWKEFVWQKVDGQALKEESGLYVLKTIDNVWTGSIDSIENLEPFRAELAKMVNS